jgi:hypothetical protein
VASNFGFGQTQKFWLFQSRFLATLLEDCASGKISVAKPQRVLRAKR